MNLPTELPVDTIAKKPKRKVECNDLLSSSGFSLFIEQFYETMPEDIKSHEFVDYMLDLAFQFSHWLYEGLSTSHVLSRIRAIPGKEKMLSEIRRVTRKVYGIQGNDEFSQSMAAFAADDSLIDTDSSWLADNPESSIRMPNTANANTGLNPAREESDDDI